EPAQRKKYLTQLDAIEKDARKAFDGADSTADKGKKLLKVLHDGPMSKGYSAEQTDLTVLLAEGRFNCVSSAVLYNIIATRVGLEVQGMAIPAGPSVTGHIFSVLKDGTREIPIETTHPLGFAVHDNMKKKNKQELS